MLPTMRMWQPQCTFCSNVSLINQWLVGLLPSLLMFYVAYCICYVQITLYSLIGFLMLPICPCRTGSRSKSWRSPYAYYMRTQEALLTTVRKITGYWQTDLSQHFSWRDMKKEWYGIMENTGRDIVQVVSRWRPEFNPTSVRVGFVMDKVALWLVSSDYFEFPCQFSF
jgi:hypothetical protein